MQARVLPWILLATVLCLPLDGAAQPEEEETAGEAAPGEEPPAEREGEGEGEEGQPPPAGEGGPLTPRLRAPLLQGEGEESEGEGEEEEREPELGPDEARERLLSVEEPLTRPSPSEEDLPDLGTFALKALPLFAVHGYFRTRFELFQNFHLGRSSGDADAFHRPIEAINDDAMCGDTAGGSHRCSSDNSATLAGANLRFRLEPQINVSDEVQVNSRIDILDNLVLGSTPEGYVDDRFAAGRSSWVPLEAFTSTQVPPEERNSYTDSIAVKHAWAQVRTSLGVLRFGRMGSDWGLGLLANGGNDIDSDYGDIADRILFATRVAGITIVPIWDFASEGAVSHDPTEFQGQPHDLGQLDDVSQYILVLARKLDEEDFEDRLQLGLATLQGGVYLVYRNQVLSSEGRPRYDSGLDVTPDMLVRRNAHAWIPDLWLRFDYRKLRLEAEGVWIAGEIENIQVSSDSVDEYDVNQLGGAFQLEYRLLADKLMLGFETGYASGDENIDGMNPGNQLLAQNDGDSSVTNFKFDRDYYVDLILWRNILGTFNSAYYFKPSIAYNFIDDSVGQLFGARLDIVWSRASELVQTRGNHGDLGLEFDISFYYRSADGTSREDGFVAGLQYGLLVPLAGMYNQDNEEHAGDVADLSNAQVIRAVLGVVY